MSNTNKESLEREQLLDEVEEAFVMGITRPAQLLRIGSLAGRIKEWETAKRYLEIVRRRIRNRYSEIIRDKIFKKELRDLDFMERKLWIVYSTASLPNDKTGVINSIIKIKERRAQLLGFDSKNLKVSGGIADILDEIAKNQEPLVRPQAGKLTSQILEPGSE